MKKLQISAECNLFIFYAVAVVLQMVEMIVFTYDIGDDNQLLILTVLFGGESVLLMSPVLWLRGKWRRVVLAIAWFAAFFLFANGIYVRYWHDTIPFALIFNTATYNGASFALAALGQSLRWIDLIYIIVPLAITLLYQMYRSENGEIKNLPSGFRIAAAICAAGVYCLSVAAVMWSEIRYYHRSGAEYTWAEWWKVKTGAKSTNIGIWHSNGLIIYTACQFGSLSQGIDELSPEQESLIKSYLTELDGLRQQPDSVFAANADKNLILIIVESLNSWAVGLEKGGVRLTPTLDSLIAAPGTIYNLDVTTQIVGGGSSDGQMIYNTGLLPIRRGATAMLFADNDFPSLAKSLGKAENVEIIVEDASVWNHSITSKSYGYERIIDKLDTKGRSADEALFDEALRVIPTLKEPYMLELTTLTMHFPFDDAGRDIVPRIEALDIDRLQRNYFNSLITFDRQLGLFLNALRRRGVLDRSIVVLASDHDQNTANDASRAVAESSERSPIAFIAIGTGITRHIDRPANQVDVHTTILDIMGSTAPWRGLSTSMLAPALPDSLASLAPEVSDLIIRAGCSGGAGELKIKN